MKNGKASLQVEVWSDIACPWCWVGKRRFESALDVFYGRDRERADEVAVTWRAFELDRSAPPAPAEPGDHAARLAKKYGMSIAQAEAATARLTSVAKADGIEMRFDRIRSGNTFDAHRLLHFAGERGVQNELKERLFKAYFSDGEAMSDRATLVRLATELGLDGAEVSKVLETNAFASEVRADEQDASDAGIRGVPFFVFGAGPARKYAVSGAQPVEVFVEALERAWSEIEQAPSSALRSSADSEVCGPDGCAVPEGAVPAE
jgi:predicted DsbA family dithiol-disulfide isomerase